MEEKYANTYNWRQIDDFETLITGSITGWGKCCSGPRWRRFRSRLCGRRWIPLSASVWGRCACSFASAARLRTLWGIILARKASGRLVLTKHSRVSCYCILHLVMPRKLNTPLLLFLDLGMWFLDQILCFLHCGARKPAIGHFGHVPGQVHVGLFQLYTTSVPWHRCRPVQYQQEISCCCKHWDAAITLTIYTSVAWSKVIKACFVHSRRCFSGNSSEKMPELTTSWCSTLRTVQTNALVDPGCCLLLAAINWSHSSRCTPAIWYMVNWRPLTTVWRY